MGQALLSSQPADAPPVVITTAALNVSLEKRTAAQVSAAPFTCETGAAATVAQVPSGALPAEVGDEAAARVTEEHRRSPGSLARGLACKPPPPAAEPRLGPL